MTEPERPLPLLGTERGDGLDWHCGYAHGPGHPDCLDDAVWHGIVLTGDYAALQTLLSSCDRHKPQMALTADFIHEMSSACGLEESTIWWHGPTGTSGCRIDWDLSVLAEASAEPCEASVSGARA